MVEAQCIRVDSNPVAGTKNHKPGANSAVHPSEVGKRVLRGNSEGKSCSFAGPHQQYRTNCHFPSSLLSTLTNERCLLAFPILLFSYQDLIIHLWGGDHYRNKVVLTF